MRYVESKRDSGSRTRSPSWRPAGHSSPVCSASSRRRLSGPRGSTNTCSAEQIDAILAHEVTHVRRCDNLGALVHLCAQAVFWFHPLVWWIGARLVDERERACDEEVLGVGSEPSRVRREHPQDLPAGGGVSARLRVRRHWRGPQEANRAHHDERDSPQSEGVEEVRCLPPRVRLLSPCRLPSASWRSRRCTRVRPALSRRRGRERAGACSKSYRHREPSSSVCSHGGRDPQRPAIADGSGGE